MIVICLKFAVKKRNVCITGFFGDRRDRQRGGEDEKVRVSQFGFRKILCERATHIFFKAVADIGLRVMKFL